MDKKNDRFKENNRKNKQRKNLTRRKNSTIQKKSYEGKFLEIKFGKVKAYIHVMSLMTNR